MREYLKYFFILNICCHQAMGQLLPFRSYSAKDGLNSKNVYSVIRDNRGLIWAGTPFGINWFDGSRFYQPPVISKAGQLYVINFYKDNKGIIWVLTFYNGIYKFQDNRFSNYMVDTVRPEATANNVFDMIQTGNASYIVATDNNAYNFDGTHFNLFDKTNKDLNGQVNTLARLKNGDVLLGNSTGVSYYSYQNNHWQFSKKILPGYEINKIITRGEQTWVATNKGLLYFDTLLLNEKPTRTYLQDQPIGYVSSSSTGEIWISGSSGIYKLLNTELTRYDATNGLPASARQIYSDNNGIAWISTNEGLYKLNQEYYQFDNFREAALDKGVADIAKDKEGNLWIANYQGLIKQTGVKYQLFKNVHGENIGTASLLFKDTYQRLWAGTQAGILQVSGDRIVKKYPLLGSVFYEDEQSNLWIGTTDGKLFILQNNQLRQIKFPGTGTDFIASIYKDKYGLIWLGFRNSGLVKYRVKGLELSIVKEFSGKTGFENLRIRCSSPDARGHIIFGTRTKGIFVFSVDNDTAWWQINSDKGLSANWVKAITVIGDKIYLATNNGVNILSSGNYQQPAIHIVRISNDNISPETNCILRSGDKVWIGTDNGLLTYFPSKDLPDKMPPRVFLTQLSIEGKADSAFIPYSQDYPALHLPHYKNVIAFEFAGIHLVDESKIRYRYTLVGQDRGWSSPTDRNFVSYNLPSGSYTFKVEAQNAKGIWSTNPVLYNFSIAQPYWNTWWFFTLCILLAISIIYCIYRYRLQQVLKLAGLRTKISTDLHDDIGSTLSSISILSDMALQENNKAQSNDMIAEIKDNSIILMEKMDDIVWSINPRNDSIEILLLRIKHFASQLFEAKDINYSIEIDASVKEVKLTMEYRQHIYLILKEAINNLVKYADCTNAGIDVSFGHGLLNVMINDNGKGFDQQQVLHGNGLLSMQNRAAFMKANLQIQSYPGQGTTVLLKVKIK